MGGGSLMGVGSWWGWVPGGGGSLMGRVPDWEGGRGGS